MTTGACAFALLVCVGASRRQFVVLPRSRACVYSYFSFTAHARRSCPRCETRRVRPLMQQQPRSATDEGSGRMSGAGRKRIVLVGGGHAHVQVIKGLHPRFRPADVDVVLIDQNETAFYSGMMPACVAGIYDAKETHIQLVPLAKWAGIRFVHARVVAINAGTRPRL